MKISPNYCLVTQRIVAITADSDSDDDRLPDQQTVSGEVYFTPNVASGRAYQLRDEEGKSYTVPLGRVEASIVDGEIVHEGQPGISLFAAGQGSNPGKISYLVEYRNLRAGGTPISLSPMNFEAIPGGEVDLTAATPVTGATPAGTTKGDKGDPFLYEDFTPEQLEALRGDPFLYEDFTPEQLEALTGPPGDVSLDQLNAKADKTAVDEAVLGISNPEQSADELRDTAKTYYWSSDANAAGKNLPVDRAGVLTNYRMSWSDSSSVQTYLPFRNANVYVRYFYQNAPYTDYSTGADGWVRYPSSWSVESMIADAIANIDTGSGEDATPARSSLTNITCFGDSLTEGYSNNAKWGDEDSYPAALERELGAGVTVTNRGMSGASSATINLRAGATPITFRVPAGTIPGARWAVIPLETSQEHNEWASGAVNRYGYIGGGYGLLKLVDGAWTFTRNEAVDDMTVDVVEFLGEYKVAAGDTIIYGAGRNDITKNLRNIYPSPVESVKASVIEMLDFANADVKQVAFLGTITRTDETPESEGYKQVYEVNDWIRDHYPDRHIDLQGYLTGSQVWTDTGITPTQTDLDAQAQGMTPPSLFDDVTHYSKATAEAIGSKLVAGWLRARGWVI